MATENNWGFRRIAGELKKLAIDVGYLTVGRIIKEEGINTPSPHNRKPPPVSWSIFIESHVESIVATDFFSKPIWTLRGKVDAYCLFFIHIGTRKVFCSPVTLSPNENRVMQQARNFIMWIEDNNLEMRFLIHDRDTKYTAMFDKFFNRIFKELKGQVIKTAVRTPDMNAYAESFVGTIKRECLNYFTCISLSQVDYIIAKYASFYNTVRPHQGKGIDNNVLDADFKPPDKGKIKCKKILGGILRHYYRDAA